MKKISIITPLYNAESFIEETITSVQKQTYPNWEMIIVDDKSSDNSYQIAKKATKKDPRIKILKNSKNLGGAKSRNIAIKKAQGEIIAFLDADDSWEKEKLETQLKFMSKNNISFCFSDYKTIDEQGKYLNLIKTPKQVSLKDMYSHNYIGCLTAMYDTAKYGKFYMPEIRKRQDFALWLLMLEKFEYAHSINQPLASYRIRKESLSTNKLDAVKFYWKVLREVAHLPSSLSLYYTTKYIALTAIKRKNPELYTALLRIQ